MLTPNSPARARISAWISFVIATLFFLFEFVVRIEPSLASVDIAHAFGLSNASFATLSSLFFWVYAPMQLVVGLALDRFGARKLVVPAIVICAAGMNLFATAQTPAVAAFGRLLTGFGASFGFVGALYIVNHRFAPSRFALLSGIVNAVGMMGTAMGAVVLSGLVGSQGWQAVFQLTSYAGFGLFFLAFVALHDGRDAPERSAQRHPLSPLKPLLSNGRIWIISVLGALYYMPINVYGGLWGEQQLTTDHALSDVSAELAISMIFWGMAVGSVAGGGLSDLLGHRKWIIIISACLAAACYSAAIYGPFESVLPLATLLFFAGLFCGPQMLCFAMAKEGHPATVSGTVIAVVNMVGIGGALLFQPLIGLIVDRTGGDFGLAMLTIPACLLSAAFLALPLSQGRHSDHTT